MKSLPANTPRRFLASNLPLPHPAPRGVVGVPPTTSSPRHTTYTQPFPLPPLSTRTTPREVRGSPLKTHPLMPLRASLMTRRLCKGMRRKTAQKAGNCSRDMGCLETHSYG